MKQKISGCFRPSRYAQAGCRVTRYLQSMSDQGYRPITAIEIALKGEAATILKNSK